MSQGTFEYVHALMFTYDWGIDLSQFLFCWASFIIDLWLLII